jgi:hypothetical protein
MSASTSSGHVPALALIRVVPILLQKSAKDSLSRIIARLPYLHAQAKMLSEYALTSHRA